MALYTPFFERNSAKLADAMIQKRAGELAQDAYMGDPQALGELYRFNPQQAQQIQAQQRQQAQTRLAQQKAQQDQLESQEKKQAEMIEYLDALESEAGQMGSLEEAQALIDRRMARAYPEIEVPRLDESAWAQIRGIQEDDRPARLVELTERAAAAGLEEGSDEYKEFMFYGGPKDESAADQRDRKIGDYMRLFSMSEEDATRAVDSSVMLDDRGNVISFDPISQQGALVDIDVGQAPESLNTPRPASVEDLAFDPAKGTGFARSFIGLWNSTAGQLPFVPVGEETEQAAQNLRVLERDAINALASSGRPPLVEQERIMSIVPDAMAWTQNPEIAQYKMTNFIDLMMNQYVDDIRFSQDRRNPKNVRETSSERARKIESIVRRVMTPEAADSMFQSLARIEEEVGDIQGMSNDDLMNMDVSEMTDAQLDLYIERLSGGN